MPEIREETIVGFEGSWSSGLAHLVIETEEGTEYISCDNGATVRALDACFGDVIGAGHTCFVDAIKGKSIKFATDGLGLLEWFKPVKGICDNRM